MRFALIHEYVPSVFPCIIIKYSYVPDRSSFLYQVRLSLFISHPPTKVKKKSYAYYRKYVQFIVSASVFLYTDVLSRITNPYFLFFFTDGGGEGG